MELVTRITLSKQEALAYKIKEVEERLQFTVENKEERQILLDHYHLGIYDKLFKDDDTKLGYATRLEVEVNRRDNLFNAYNKQQAKVAQMFVSGGDQLPALLENSNN